MDADTRTLAALINNGQQDPLESLKLRRGIITAVDRATNTYTVTIGGASVAGIPAQSHVYAQVNDVVDILIDGPAPRIIGVTGLANGLPDTNSYTFAYTATNQTIASAAWTRLTGMSATEGNAALWDGTNQWYTVPSTGLYHVEARVRFNDGQTSGLNVALGVDTTDTATDARSMWGAIPTVGTQRRLNLSISLLQRLTAGQQMRAAMYMDGASMGINARSLSIVKLGA